MVVDIGEVNTGLLLNIPQRPPELGRIRLGEKGTKGEPVRLKTFRLTSSNRATLEAAAVLYGGKVQAWQGAPDEGMWQLTTAVAELDILIPTNLRSVSQAYELWQGGTCERRCDGTTAATPQGAVPCICAAKKLDGADRECEIMTRLSVMLPRVPGLGVWRLDTGGYLAATTLPSTLTLLAGLARGPWAHAVLRAEQRSKKERLPGGKVQTHRFVVPVLDLPGTTLGQLVPGAEIPQPALLEPGERPAPPTARDRVAEARRVAEAAATADVPVVVTPLSAEGSQPANAAVRDLAQCDETAPYEGNARCRREDGHPGLHSAGSKESWE